MNHPSDGRTSGNSGDTATPEGERGIDLFAVFWRARKALVLSMLVISLLYGGIAVNLWSWAPVRTRAVQDFSFVFDGVEKNRYPNGTPFSAKDLLAEPVLKTVFEELHLSDFMKPDQFAAGLSVHDGAGVDLALLQADYGQRLQNTKLTQPEREKLEKDYRDELEKLKGGLYVLEAEFAEARLSPAVYTQILSGVLDGWARYARQTRGVAVYDLPVPKITAFESGQSILDQWAMVSEEIEQSEKLVRLALLLPGASQVRDEKGGGLLELQRRMTVLRKTRFEPLTDEVYAADADEGVRRLQSNVEASQVRYDAAKARADAAREVFQQYVAMARGEAPSSASGAMAASDVRGSASSMPTTINLPENLITKLVEMRSLEGDTKYRQKLNDDIIQSTAEMLESQRALKADQKRLEKVTLMRENLGTIVVDANLIQSVTAMKKQLADEAAALSGFIAVLAERNLNPSSVLYRLDGPPQVVADRSISLRQIGLGFFGVIAIGIAVSLLLTIRSERAPA